MIVRCIAGDTWVTVTPITRDQFATEFVRRGRYAAPAFWDELFLARVSGIPGAADQALRRVEYSWTTRRQSVRSVSWFEADAFARSLRGRLPSSVEWAIWSRTPSTAAGVETGRFSLFGSRKREPARPPEEPSRQTLRELQRHYDFGKSCMLNGFLVEPELGEWCSDHFHATLSGPDLLPDVHERRRTFWVSAGSEHRGVAAGHRAPNLGFRMVFEGLTRDQLRPLGTDWWQLRLRGSDV